MRKIVLATDYIYHILNRGVEKREIFLDSSFYSRFIAILEYYLSYDYPYSVLKRQLKLAQSAKKKQEILLRLETRRIIPAVEIISFCLMPNHYHLLLRQLTENGITNFMHKIGTSYSGYFNIRQDRSGRLFEGPFKAVMVESDEQLLHLTRYQHLNPRSLGLNTPRELIDYSWSSLSTYLGKKRFPFIKPDMVLSTFNSPKNYLDFVLGEIDDFEPVRLDETAIDDDFSWFAKFRKLEKNRQEQLRQHYLDRLS